MQRNDGRPLPTLDWTGKVAQHAQETKIKHYTSKYHINPIDVVPVAYDTYGYLCKRAREYFKKAVGKDMNGMLKRMNAAFHRGNAAVLTKARRGCYATAP